MTGVKREIIVVRSLTESDLGLFAAHRTSARSKQRALNINAAIARELLSERLYENGQADLTCLVTFGNTLIHEVRRFGKTHKNWRLGGKKIEGELFARLDSKDFILIRSIAHNDGNHPLTIAFACRATDRVVHAGLGAIVQRKLQNSMAIFEEDGDGFLDIATYCQIRE